MNDWLVTSAADLERLSEVIGEGSAFLTPAEFLKRKQIVDLESELRGDTAHMVLHPDTFQEFFLGTPPPPAWMNRAQRRAAARAQRRAAAHGSPR